MKTAWHGPGDGSPVGHACNLALALACANFGVQESVSFDEKTREVFSGCPERKNGYLWANEAPGSPRMCRVVALKKSDSAVAGEGRRRQPATPPSHLGSRTLVAWAAGWLLAALPAGAQVSQPTTDTPLTGLSLGFEVRRDRFGYRFENPSSFDTAELVPHFFEQRYDADNSWLTARAGYRLGGRLLETEGGVSLSGEGSGSDYDTFSQPDGDVVVYGTTAVTELRSWRAAQFVGLGAWRGLTFRAGYAYRRDRSVFQPSETTITHTQPPSSTSFWNTNRETTESETHQVLLGTSWARDRPAWLVRLTLDLAPTTLARLTTHLPDKYDAPVVFSTTALTVDARLDLRRSAGRWTLGARVACSRAWSYSDADRFRWSGLGIQAEIGFR